MSTTTTGGFQAWYEVDAGGKSKIVVSGEKTASGGATLVIARHEDQGSNPRVLRLRLSKAGYPGKLHPQFALRKSLHYEEPAGQGSFDQVHIQSEGDEFVVPVDRTPPAPSH